MGALGLATGISGLALIVATVVGAPAGKTTEGPVTCTDHFVPISGVGGLPALSRVHGRYCATSPQRQATGGTVQLLIHGATYDHRYWDFGVVNGFDYSYARHLAAAGFPTFAIDKLGVGQSSRPLSPTVSTNMQAAAIHQVVRSLRGTPDAWTLPEVRHFDRVIAVGHSLGSLTTWRLAIDYPQDLDGMIITGMVHHFSRRAGETFVTGLHPGAVDPKFFGEVLDPGWLTTKPEVRGRAFYNLAYADPAVIALDEARKDMFSSAEVNAFPPIFTTDTDQIKIPVMVVMGSHDLLCEDDGRSVYDCSTGDALLRQETPHYGSAEIWACAVTPSGHDLTLQTTASVFEAAATAWSHSVIGQDGQTTPKSLPPACGSSR